MEDIKSFWHAFFKEMRRGYLKDMKVHRWCNIANDSSEFLERLFDAITDPIIIFDTELRIIKINKAAVRFFPSTPGGPVGKRCFAIKHTMAPICKDCPAWQTIRTGKTVSTEMYDPHTGTALLIKTYPIFDEAGEINAVALVGQANKRVESWELGVRSRELNQLVSLLKKRS